MTGKSVEQFHHISPFGGVDHRTPGAPELIVEDNDFEQLTNFIKDRAGHLMPRIGVQGNTDHGETDGYVAPVGFYSDNVLFVANDKLFKINIQEGKFEDDTATEILYSAASITGIEASSFTLASDGYFYFIKDGDDLYRVDPTGSTATQVTTAITAGVTINSLKITEKDFRLFLANDARLAWSAIGDYTSWGEYLDIPAHPEVSGNTIHEVIPFNDLLYIFTDQQIWALDITGEPADWELTLVSNEHGAITRYGRGVVEHNNVLYVLDRTGLYAFDGFNSAKLSDKINEFFPLTFGGGGGGGVSNRTPCIARVEDNLLIQLVSRDGSEASGGSRVHHVMYSLTHGSFSDIVFAAPGNTTFNLSYDSNNSTKGCSGMVIGTNDEGNYGPHAKGFFFSSTTDTNAIPFMFLNMRYGSMYAGITVERTVSGRTPTSLDNEWDDYGQDYECWFKTKAWNLGSPIHVKRIKSVNLAKYGTLAPTLNYRHTYDGTQGSILTRSMTPSNGLLALRPPPPCRNWALECWFIPDNDDGDDWMAIESLSATYHLKSQRLS